MTASAELTAKLAQRRQNLDVDDKKDVQDKKRPSKEMLAELKLVSSRRDTDLPDKDSQWKKAQSIESCKLEAHRIALCKTKSKLESSLHIAESERDAARRGLQRAEVDMASQVMELTNEAERLRISNAQLRSKLAELAAAGGSPDADEPVSQCS